ncbi:MAG: oligoendopeptidase F [Tumebacillaceae bacterium]
MSTTTKKRSEVQLETTWNLEAMYESNDAWEQDFKKVEELYPQVVAYAGRLGESADTLLAALNLQHELESVFENVYTYANMRYHQDTANATYQGMSDRASVLANNAFGATSFMNPELLALPEAQLEQFMNENEELRLYKIAIDRLLRDKDHVLSPAEEELLARMGDLAQSSSTVFSMLTNADMTFESVEDSEGNVHEVTEGMYYSLLQSKDRVLRERAFKRIMGTYGNYRNTLGATYGANVKKGVFYAQARKYNSVLEMSLHPDNVPVDVYNNLIQTVRDNFGTMHRYVELRKKVLGVDELHYYDLFTSIVDTVEVPMTYETGKQLALESLAPLGEEYVQTLQRSFDERWIDVYPNVGKRTGAYSWGTYTSLPYVLLNYTDRLDDVFTLVHELGHAMHSYFTRKTQPYPYGNYTIFVAEVASTLNENLLLEKLLKDTTDKKQRMYLLNHSLDQFRSTMYRQTMFAEFEKAAHGMAEEGQPLTADHLSEVYNKLNRDYYGPTLVIDEELNNEWSRIPHFYNAFYVYKYATGFAAATTLARQIINEGQPAIDRYLDFLRSGSIKDPIDLLKGAGVDMSSPQPIHDALQVFKERLDELEALFNEQE